MKNGAYDAGNWRDEDVHDQAVCLSLIGLPHAMMELSI